MRLKDLVIETEGPVVAEELFQKIKECGLDKQAKKFRKKTVILVHVDDVVNANLPVGTIDGLNKVTPDEIYAYVKKHNDKGLLAVQLSNGKLDIYPIGEKALKRYKKGGNPDRKIIDLLKNYGIEKYELIVGNVDVNMIQVKDLKKCKNIDEMTYNRLLKNGLLIKAWGNEVQKVDGENAFLVIDDGLVYTIAPEGDLPTNYERA
jgi:hypothetical protein